MQNRRLIVAVPGTLCSPAIFDPVAERLAPVAVVEAVSWMTWPGPWDIPAVARLLAASIERGPMPVTLIGHSTGGAIVQQLVLERPELVDLLVLVDTGPNMHVHGDVDAIITTIERSWGDELFGAILDRSFAAPLGPDVRDRFLGYARTVEQRAALDVLRSQRSTDLSGRLGEIRCPTVVLHGRQDPTRTVDQARQLAGAIPGAALHLLDSGHSPMFEDPDAVAAILRRAFAIL